MPQDIEFHLPFPVHVSPEEDHARTRALAWARHHELITTPSDEHRFTSWDIAGLMARWAPCAVGAGLDLAVNAVNVLTIVDDQLDGSLATRPEEVTGVCGQFRRITHAKDPLRAAATAGPLARAYADVLSRLYTGRSSYFRAKTASQWSGFLDACVEETYNRADRHTPSRDEYFITRRRSGVVPPMIGMVEAACNFEVPRRIYELPASRRMVEIVADVVDAINDVHSVEKEEHRGDVHNLVLVIEHETGASRAACLAEIVELVGAWTTEFLSLEGDLDQYVTDAADRTVARLFVDALRAIMPGYCDWSATTRRYSDTIPATEPAYSSVL